MSFYLTGAKFYNAVQNDPNLSLGGYLSSSVVPFGSLNGFFSEISKLARERKYVETRAIVFVNDTGATMSNINLWFNYPNTDFTNATVEIDGDGSGATATATITNGQVSTITVTSGGSGYSWATVTITGDGWNANAVASINSTGQVSTITVSPGTIVKFEVAAVSLVSNQQMEKIANIRSSPVSGTFYEPSGISNKILLSNSLVNGGTIGLWLRRTVLYNAQTDPINQQKTTVAGSDFPTLSPLEQYINSLQQREDVKFSLQYD